VPAAVVVRRGPRWFVVETPGGVPVGFPEGRLIDPKADRGPPRALLDRLRSVPPTAEIRAVSPDAASRVAAAVGRPVAAATLAESRSARGRLPPEDLAEERRYVLAVAHDRLETALRAPEEVLITLAREEERFERALGREERAAAAFLPASVDELRELEAAWGGVRERLVAHHGALRHQVEAAAERIVPNLSALVGPRIAARLVAAAGGVDALARLRAPRLQLLGSRRRPSADRGPRFGILYRAARMDDVPLDRRAALARSVAALAAIAARADATTHRDLAALLVARRDLRIEALRRRRA
jgi:hypothetical protein